MTINDKIEKLNIKLPQAKPPVGSYVATKITATCYSSQVKYLLMKMVN